VNKRVPEHLAERITRRGGLAENGRPLFRVIHGSDRLTTVGGEWTKFDNQGNETGHETGYRQCVKYPHTDNCYIFEAWCPAENYGTREDWEQNFTKHINGMRIETLGGYPENGEYELVMPLKTPKGYPVELTDTICDVLVDTAVKNKHLATNIRMEAFRDKLKKKEQAEVGKRAAMIDSMSKPEWAYGPHVVMPSDLDISKFS
jgi:hypothetical protein